MAMPKSELKKLLISHVLSMLDDEGNDLVDGVLNHLSEMGEDTTGEVDGLNDAVEEFKADLEKMMV